MIFEVLLPYLYQITLVISGILIGYFLYNWNQGASSTLIDLKRQINNLKSSLKYEQAYCAELESQCDELESDNKSLIGEVEEEKLRTGVFEHQLETVQEQHVDTINNLNCRISRLKESNQDQHRQIERINKRLKSAQESEKIAMTAKQEAEKAMKESAAQMESLKTLVKQLRERQTELEHSQNSSTDHAEQILGLENRLEDAQSELKDLQSKEESTSAKNQSMSAELQKTIKDVETERARADAAEWLAEKSQAVAAQAQSTIMEAQSVAAVARADADAAKAELESLRESMHESKETDLPVLGTVGGVFVSTPSQDSKYVVAADDLEPKILKFEPLKLEPKAPARSLSPGEINDSEYNGIMKSHPSRGQIYVSTPEYRDDLKQISGIAEVLEAKLNDFGVYTFKQIMDWQNEEIQEFSNILGTFQDRIHRDGWVYQATVLYQKKHQRAA